MLNHIVMFRRWADMAADAVLQAALIADLKPYFEWAAVDYTV
jgi:hypothetical protein